MARRLSRYTPGVIRTKRNTIARTDTTAKTLFSLPRGARIIGWLVDGAEESDAGTAATLDVGIEGNTDLYIDGHNVKAAATGLGSSFANGLASGGAAKLTEKTTILGLYAETGTASEAGGPWTVTCLYEG